MSNTEQNIEQEIQDKGLNAPRLTPDCIDNKILSCNYFIAGQAIGEVRSESLPIAKAVCGALDTLTFCVLVLDNGFTVTGESACASPENFDAEVGRKIAYKNAREKIWELEGYLLKQKLHEQSLVSASVDDRTHKDLLAGLKNSRNEMKIIPVQREYDPDLVSKSNFLYKVVGEGQLNKETMDRAEEKLEKLIKAF